MTDITYPVMERFLTVQGEGAHAGRTAWFIRLGGCDVGCVWCDVKESWDVNAHPKVALSELVQEAADSGAPICVITGGEPLMHDCGPLTAALRDAGIRVHLETSGAHPLTGTWDWITLSPKKFKKALQDIFPRADELKVVVVNLHDFQWAEEHAAELRLDAVRLLQPEWDRREKVLPRILHYMREHPEWRLSLQTHKYIGLP